jgi:ornithine cyclodeaminase
VVAGGERRRPDGDLSIFKAMGMGISDLALGAEIYARAVQTGKGRPFPHPQRAKPRIRVSNRATAAWRPRTREGNSHE